MNTGKRLRPLALVLLAAPAFAADSVDLQVGPRDKVLGTIRPAAESESYVVSALRGTSVRAIAKIRGEGGPRPALALLDGGDVSVTTGTQTDRGASIADFELPSGGLWRFRVAGDALLDGDYQLALKLVPRANWSETAKVALDAGFETTFDFAAPAGAVAVIDVRSLDGDFAPRILSVSGPTGALHPETEPDSPRLHRVSGLLLPVAGEHQIRFRNAGAAPGLWKVRVRLAFDGATRATVDLTDEALAGSFAGTQTVFGRIATPDAATLLEGPAGSGLEGVSILIPAGALAVPTLVGMSQSETFFAGDDANPAGSAISFTPAGTTFDVPASITQPYDAQAFDDPATELTAVAVEDEATGATEIVPVTSVDTTAQTVTYPATHFSRFQPVSPRPRSLRGNFREVELVGRSLDAFGGSITLGLHTFRGLQGQRSQHGMTREVNRLTVEWTLDGEGIGRFTVTPDVRSTGGIVQVQSDAQVQLVNGGGDFSLTRGRSPDALGSAAAGPGAVETHLAYRRTPGLPTRGNLAGGWHGVAWQFVASDPTGAGARLDLAGQDFELDVDPAGVATMTSSRLRRSVCDLGRTPWRDAVGTGTPKPGHLDPDGDAVRLTMALLGGTFPRVNQLDPVLRGDALVGGAMHVEPGGAAPTAAVLRVVVLVRRTSDLLPEQVLGRSAFASFAARTVEVEGQPSQVDFTTTTADLSFGVDGTFALTGTQTLLGHTAAGLPVSGTLQANFGGTFRVSPDGRIVLQKPTPLAFLTPRRGAFLVFDTKPGTYILGEAVPSRPLVGSRE